MEFGETRFSWNAAASSLETNEGGTKRGARFEDKNRIEFAAVSRFKRPEEKEL